MIHEKNSNFRSKKEILHGFLQTDFFIAYQIKKISAGTVYKSIDGMRTKPWDNFVKRVFFNKVIFAVNKKTFLLRKYTNATDMKGMTDMIRMQTCLSCLSWLSCLHRIMFVICVMSVIYVMFGICVMSAISGMSQLHVYHACHDCHEFHVFMDHPSCLSFIYVMSVINLLSILSACLSCDKRYTFQSNDGSITNRYVHQKCLAKCVYLLAQTSNYNEMVYSTTKQQSTIQKKINSA